MLVDGNGKADWVKILGILSPLLPLALVGFLFMAGMLETPEQKSRRISEIVNKAILHHSVIAGHPVMVERTEGIRSDVGELRTDIGDVQVVVKENTATLARIEVLIIKRDHRENQNP